LTRTQRAQERFARKNEAAELRRAFDTLDTKADGRLDAEELGRLLAKLSHRARKARLQHCLKHPSGHKLSIAAAQSLDTPERLDISSRLAHLSKPDAEAVGESGLAFWHEE